MDQLGRELELEEPIASAAAAAAGGCLWNGAFALRALRLSSRAGGAAPSGRCRKKKKSAFAFLIDKYAPLINYVHAQYNTPTN